MRGELLKASLAGGMLLLLRRLHTTYREAEKLAQVERQLREAGYTK